VTLRRATGQPGFADDLPLAGRLHVAILRSPHPHARIAGADAGAARALPGVVAVLTHQEAPDVLDDVVRFVGDRVAVVAAEDSELALRAAEMVEVTYEPLPPVLDAEAAAAEPGRRAASVTASAGDAASALAKAERVVGGAYHLPRALVLSIEPHVALTWLGEDGRLVVRASTESAFRARGRLAERLGLPAARIRVVQPLVGGAPGGKAEPRDEDLCALVTLKTGRPARLVFSAGEEPAATRPAQWIELRMGLHQGTITALDVRCLMDLGASNEAAEEILRSAGRDALGLYRVENVAFEATAVRTHRPPAGALHGAEAAVGFALECAVDEAAAALGEDPVAFRLRHLRAPDEAAAPATQAFQDALGEVVPSSRDSLAELLRTGTRASGWSRRWSSATARGPLRRGFGVAVARRSADASGGSGGTASLRLLEDGSFSLAAGPFTAGAADEGDWAQAAAAILGVPARRVVAAAADADTAPFDPGASSSLQVGQAVEETSRRMRDRILMAGARMLGVEPARALVEHGHVRAREGRAVSFAEVGAAALRGGEPLAASASPRAASVPPAHACVFAEAEVDLETGLVRVTSLHAAVDAGPFEDPRPAEGEVEGALVASLGRAMAEATMLDPSGRPLARSRPAWSVPSPVDVPPITVAFEATGGPPSRFGAAPAAEAAGRAALAAIVNAVAHAAGGRPRTLPLLPERVLSSPGGA